MTDVGDSPYDILDLDISATQDEIKKRYRYLSLCAFVSLHSFFEILNFFPVIHPDKCPHEKAPEAFDLLKKVRLRPPVFFPLTHLPFHRPNQNSLILNVVKI